MQLQRHDLVWLTTAGWRHVQAREPRALPRRLLECWSERSWPLVARRRDPETAEDVLSLGLQQPVRGRERRVTLLAPAEAADRTSRPLPLASALEAAPPRWRRPITDLCRSAERKGIVLEVYGSLAWQALTGLEYVTDASDLDVLARPGSACELEAVLDLLTRHVCGLPVDGELIFPNGLAVAWREVEQLRANGWRGLALAKTLTTVKFVDAIRLRDPRPEKVPC